MSLLEWNLHSVLKAIHGPTNISKIEKAFEGTGLDVIDVIWRSH